MSSEFLNDKEEIQNEEEEEDGTGSLSEDGNLSDDDEDEEEPKLKFDRIKNDLPNILDKDAVSCVAVHPKFICVGSYRGQIYIFDPLGNNVTASPKKSIEAHKVAVNQISIDSNGDFIATCSDDGKVNIYNICDGEQVLSLSLDRKVHCVAIDPLYYKGGLSRRFIIGDENVTFYERNIFSRLKCSIISKGVGFVQNIKWLDRFCAWSWRNEVCIYDTAEMVLTGRVPFPSLPLRPSAPSSSKCSLYWKDSFTLAIAWGPSLQIVTVRRKEETLDSGSSSSSSPTPSHYVIILNMIGTPYRICGLASFAHYYILLCLGEERGERPKLHIIETERLSYEVVYTHILQTRGWEKYEVGDYHLESLAEELLFFIVTPKDIILSKSRDMDDHIQWLMEHEKYEEALVSASQNFKLLQKHSIIEVGKAYLDHLINLGRFQEAGKLCLQILGKAKREEWEKQVLKFSSYGQLRSIAPYLPRAESTKLKEFCYELVLFDYLKHDAAGFLTLVRDWAPPPLLYNVPTLINAVIDHLLIAEPDNKYLLMALADLYSYDNKYGKALAMYLKLQDPHVFVLVQKHNLFKEIRENVEDLMALNTGAALDLFMKHRDDIKPSLIVSKLQGNRYYLYQYLDSLYELEGKEMLGKFHGLLVSLYADYGPDKLLQFLKSSDQYPMQEAMIICKKRQLYSEMIYLLSRMGNAKEALRLILTELEDINQAIDFCKVRDDGDLWNDLIDFSMDKPSYIQVLLCNIGTHVDPQILIRKIENGMEIPGLRDSLVKIMQDYSLQVSLQEGCKNILVGDCLVLFEKLVRLQLHGVNVDEEHRCCSCNKKIIIPDFHRLDDIKVFYCKHMFHESCLSAFDAQNCIMCNLTEKRIGILDKL